MTERIAGIVLAGGRSARFGRDKLAEPIDGKPMLEVVIDSLRPIPADVIVVGAQGTAPALPPDVKLAVDRAEFEGPLSGLASGLAVLGPRIDQVVVVGGDMPSLVPAVLRRLLLELVAHEAAVLADDAGPRPLPMAVRPDPAREAAERLLAAGERRLRALIGELDTFVIPPATWRRDDPDAATLRDVDTPADLP
jgi:molybdopterin-guanine dinucleotide biosynthesis protein A